MRVAAVDLGTNSTRLLVADVDDGRVEEVVAPHARSRGSARASTSGASSCRSRSRASATCSPTTAASSKRLGAERTLAVGDERVRDAENGEAFLGEIEWSYGFTTRLLSGDEEARAHPPRRRRRPRARARHARARHRRRLDRADRRRRPRTSLDLGCVRLTERFLHSDPPTREELEAAARRGRATRFPTLEPTQRDRRRRERSRRSPRSSSASTTRSGSTATASRATRSSAQLERLASLPLAERRELPGLEPERAPVIVGRRGDRPRGARPLRARRASRRASATSSTAQRSTPPRCRRPRKATRRPAPTPAARRAWGTQLVVGASSAARLKLYGFAKPA